MDEIRNRVAESKLVTFDLEAYYPEGNRIAIDIKDWLFEGLLLREKDFREQLNTHDWAQYQNSFVALNCSTDAIVPGWAYMLITAKLAPFAQKVVVGNLEQLESALFQTILEELDVSSMADKPVIIKGCSNKPVPQNAYVMATAKIQKVAKSVMYGEACSSVPLYKKK